VRRRRGTRLATASPRHDETAWGGGPLARVDPRVKIAGAAALLAANLYATDWAVSLAIAAAMIVLMAVGRIPYRRQLIAIAFPAGFAIFAVASQTVFSGENVVGTIGPVGLHSDGFLQGVVISMRILAGALVVVVLGVTTPINRLCLALRWFKVPALFVEVLQLSYRYLFDIHAEFSRMREAQRVRLGWSSTRRSLASSRALGGALFIRVYDRGLRAGEAMRSRGDGSLLTGRLDSPGILDLSAATVLTVFMILLLFIYLKAPA
jgi:cobalt/nickel transport system permease protein